MRTSVATGDGYFAAIASISSFQRGSSRRQQTTVDAGAWPRRCLRDAVRFAAVHAADDEQAFAAAHFDGVTAGAKRREQARRIVGDDRHGRCGSAALR